MLLAIAAAALTFAHPMGNFSVNHYARLSQGPGSLRIRYVLDLAEIPTFELLQQWGEGADPDAQAVKQAREWAKGLDLRLDGRPVTARVVQARVAFAEGAGNMRVARVVSDLAIDARSGRLSYEDRNYQGRSGWKEIVLPGGKDRSKELTAYPEDPLVAPLQDLRATFRFAGETAAAPPVESVAVEAPAPASAPAPAAPPALGTVVKGDFLSELLHRSEIGWSLTLIGMAAAFGLGAMHAMSPGHGKTIVAAYLVGSRGTFKHAAFLGVMVTVTHTASVFLLGFVTVFLSKYILPERLAPILGAVSGISIVWVGVTLFVRRLRKQRGRHHHDHGPGGHHHHHDHDHGHSHSHVPEGDITLGSLIALGASGGLVPCPSALVLLLSAISLGRTGLGMLLLVGFSAGLACVLMGMGVLVLCVGNLLPAGKKITGSRAFQFVPVASAALITCVGLVMTVVSLA
jgi:ABC-type nickel/cobalt efflux system permease component RcnA